MKFTAISLFLASLFFTGYNHVFAARFVMETPEEISANGSPVTVTIYLDAETDSVGGISSTFSFPSDMYDIASISTTNSVVSLWLTAPRVSNEKNFDLRTRIVFEGIFPGGFTGVRGTAYRGSRPGVIGTITLNPKHEGVGNFLLDTTEIRAGDGIGTLLFSESLVRQFSIPKLVSVQPTVIKNETEISGSSIQVELSRSNLIENNKWYLIIRDDNTNRTVDHIEIAERKEHNPRDIPMFMWRTTTSPYVLLHQSRTMYVHTKIIYNDGTFAYKTIEPVDNSQKNNVVSRILVCIGIFIAVLYRYWYQFVHAFSSFIRKKVR